ncbi:MAG: ABC transporter substrate-binding protein, partial [Promethearchaeota archaeon]
TAQVTETLFANDYSGVEPQIIGTLAKNCSWNENGTELTCFLRENVKFHDGITFNADAVKWNFDRIHHLIDLNLSALAFATGYLFVLPDGRWIVNNTQVIDEYIIKFVLNDPFAPFLQLLTTSFTSIISPTSTPFDDFLNFLTDDIVGTGPFIYNKNYNIWNVEIRLTPNPTYWGGKPKLDFLVIRYYDDTNDLWDAFIAQEVTILDPELTSSNFYVRFQSIDRLLMLKDDPKFTVQESPGLNFYYLGMNNKNINATMRKAISYAINYHEWTEGNMTHIETRARSPVPDGVKYSNTTAFEVPYYNLSIARQTLLDANWPGTAELTANDNASAGNEWEMLVSNETPLEIYNLSYWAGNGLLMLMAFYFRNYFRQIGIKVNLIGSNEQYWGDQLYIFGWIYDYNDPHNGLHAHFYSKSDVNMVKGAQLNDSLIDQWIEEGVKDLNSTSRKQTYYKLQKRLIEDLYVYAWTVSFKTLGIYDSRLSGWQPNPHLKNRLGTTYFD